VVKLVIVYHSEKLGAWNAVALRESSTGKLVEKWSVTQADLPRVLSGIAELLPEIPCIVLSQDGTDWHRQGPVRPSAEEPTT